MPGRSDVTYVAFDLETTGLSPRTDRLIEVGAVALDASLREVGRLEVLADPGIPIPLAVQRLTGLTDHDVEGAASPLEAVAQLADFAGGAVLVVHGGAMDLHVCRSLLPQQFGGRLVLDTLDLARIVMPVLENHGLPELARRLGLGHDRPHRALSDAVATGQLLVRLATEAATLPSGTLALLRRVAGADPALAHFFGTTVQDQGGGAPGPRGPEAATAVPQLKKKVYPPAAGDLERATAELLGASGPLADDPAYEYREEQVQMARAVAQSLERGRRLMVEAGTGVGKSRAYLAPLLLWSAATGSRAVVATNTVTLQEQLIDRDIPVLAGALASPPAVAMLKGRNHYISLRRWKRFLATTEAGAGKADPDRLRFTLKVAVWLTQTRTGDRSELHLTGTEEPLWRWIASDSDDCLGPVCANWSSRRCHMVAARAAAASAAIVVTNHALVLAAAERQGQVLPDYQVLVVDEAHRLEAAASEQLGSMATAADLALTLDRLPPAGADVADAVGRCREAGHRLFGDLKGFAVQQLGGSAANARITLSEELRGSQQFGTVLRSARHAVAVLAGTASMLEDASAEVVQSSLLPQPDRAEDELAVAAAALAQLASRVERILTRPAAGSVAWLELRGEQAELHEAPVDVAGPLRRLLFDGRDAAVMTSATLTVGGSFDFVRRRTGFGESVEELVLASPYDYLRQAVCVLPDGVPPYEDPAHEPAMARLVGAVAERLGGRSLVLFTSYSALRRVHVLLRERLEQAGIALLGQGLDGTRRQILRSFLEDPRTVLLGTNSFWEGIDIPSERLRCVVIDKLPFPVPTDPLVKARTTGLSDAFGQYVLPVAVLRLRQGFGRLIRSHADRGAVVLCDDRLASRTYGEVFLQALPPAAVATVPLDDVADLVDGFLHGAAVDAVGEWSDGA